MSAEEFTAPAPADSSPVEYASFGSRLGAALLDSLLGIVALLFFPLGPLADDQTAAAIVTFLILSAWFNYFAICEWRSGQTIGKWAAGIRVLPLEGGQLTWQAAAVRNLMRLVDLPLAMAGIDYLIVSRSPRHQRLGDRAAKTIVVRADEEAETEEPAAERPAVAGPTAAELFGDAVEALGRHPAAGSAAKADPEASPSSAVGSVEGFAWIGPQPRGSVSSWTASGFPYATWDVRRTVLGLLAGLLIGGLFAPLLVVPFDPDLDSTGALLVAQTLLSITLVYVAVRVASGPRRETAVRQNLSVLGLRGVRPSAFGWMALGLFSYYVFAIAYGALIVEPEQEDIARDLGIDAGFLAAIPVVALIVVVAPIAEEIFFRGMLFGGLRRRLSTILAAAISAAVFGALHATTGITAVLPLIAFGFMLALLYERTGSLGPGITAHALNNALALAVTS